MDTRWFRGEGIGAGNPSWIEHYIVHSTRPRVKILFGTS
jgi:hypothetical protein